MKVLELDLKVRIAEKLLNKIEVITSDFNMEVSGFLIGKIKDDRIIIKDIIFPKQVVTGDSVDIEAKDILPLRNDPRWNNVLGLWHSHCHNDCCQFEYSLTLKNNMIFCHYYDESILRMFEF